LFKSSRKGIILGCKVLEGNLALGKNFRVITAMGPVYSGKIGSLHVEKDAVREAKVGQKVGLKISEFNQASIGDLVECYEKLQAEGHVPWQAKGGIFVIS
jgi:translation initiation factor IF-2